MGLVKFLTHSSISPASLRHHGGGTSPGTHRRDKRLASMKLDNVRRIKRDKVVLGELIGKGGFANVHKGQFDGQTVVCKFISSGMLDDNIIEVLENECTIWAGLCHPNIVDFYGMSWTSSNIWLLCEFMPDGSLYQVNERKRLAKTPPPAEAEVLESLQQVAAGMNYLHGLKPPVLHRDLKSPNVLLAGKRLAIADFGLARYQKLDSNMTAETGSYRWMAPEVIRHEKYDYRCDVYSYAILGWELLTYSIPYSNQMPVEAAFAVAKKGSRPPLPSDTPETVRRLLEACWEQDATLRPSFATICAGLQEELA